MAQISIHRDAASRPTERPQDCSIDIHWQCRIGTGMELALNLGWAAVAIWLVCVWLRCAPRAAPERHAQLVALAVVILILLPAISMTDDLMAAQNPAEVDCCVRRNHDSSIRHSLVSPVAAVPAPLFAGVSIAFVHTAAPSGPSGPSLKHPALAPIQNRPPPAVLLSLAARF